ncbi:MAG: hypothetical protein LBD04_04160 [Synergistaceae bacterium]|jgi:predicted Fe-Mo cluster-binding NifX family protein|nr:hypothetical protein [Synergistaceae bacterium]
MIRRVAFASSDGVFIDLHYGRATAFFIYDLEGGPRLLEKRRCYRIPGQGGVEQCTAHRPEELEKAAELLKDCDALFVVKIGETPARFFMERGFRVFQLEAEIKQALEEIVKENLTEGTEE